MSILVTGFSATESNSNASDIVVSSFMSDLPGCLLYANRDLHFRLVNANTHELKNRLDALLAELKPDVCVFVGQAPGRNNITLESNATNLRLIGPPRQPGDKPESVVICATGPDSYKSTLPDLGGMVARLHESGIPAAVSIDAGNNLCNQILYEGLHYANQSTGKPLCGFVHIPALPQQVITRWPSYPFMTLEMMREAIAIVLLELMLQAI
jgi:pyroglutamyl-peptidase